MQVRFWQSRFIFFNEVVFFSAERNFVSGEVVFFLVESVSFPVFESVTSIPFSFTAGKFDLECTKFYSAQIVSALQYLHSLNIVHRDLKPENILFNDKMQIQITDFGTAKEIPESESADTPRTSSFVGTAQYVSPELLKDKQACVSSDLWALGCIIYQMLVGQYPFQAPNEYLTFQQILNCRYEFPDDFDADARDLIENLLQLDPLQRLGSASRGGYEKLKQHAFFSGINWDTLHLADPPRQMQAFMNDSSDDDDEVVDDDFDQTFINDFKNQVIEEKKKKEVLKTLSLALRVRLFPLYLYYLCEFSFSASQHITSVFDFMEE